MTRQILLSAALVAGLGGALTLWAQRPQRPDGEGPRAGHGLKARLGLSDEQVSRMREIRRTQQKAAIRSRADARIARMDLDALLTAPTIDRKAVDVKIKEISDLQQTALRARIDARIALHDVLTPEQRAKWTELKEERGERRPFRGKGPGAFRENRQGPPPADGPGQGPDAEEHDVAPEGQSQPS